MATQQISAQLDISDLYLLETSGHPAEVEVFLKAFSKVMMACSDLGGVSCRQVIECCFF